MTTTVTKESLAARIADLESGARSLKEDYTLAAFKMLLATMDSEPVAYIPKSQLNLLKNRVMVEADLSKVQRFDEIPLYRHAQPAPVIEREPIAWLNDAYLARGVVDGEAGSEDAGPGYIPVYREAGPQPAPVVPDEVRRCLNFFASVIKSGEQWTSVCQHEYDTALASMLNQK